ncbi:MAG: CoB--CoM heterodisulfide reductase iron-sulfur subunit A family protein [Chloroflexi bacterium]|nr:CoB--CoM heterodisulfide reductase iron-sulfur subunit A family protein [Chloroflexota bacterium]MBP7042741.1 CoB--CoM heterodisulfide reductase iron-sulfur subunit A family protein [Chloroflexota bacterium]
MPDKEPLPAEEIRIGVYTCQCGGNISDVVSCARVVKAAGELGNVVVSRTNMSMCSDAGQALIEADIQEKGVNRVVIGACAPSLHEQTFRGTVARAGLNPYFYNHVGIREQDSWVHHDDPDGATAKAIRLLAAGVAKARLLEPLEPIHLKAQKHALVIGGGVAGLRAALDIARRGIKVTLIEKSPFLGGHMAQLEQVFPTGDGARELLNVLIQRVVSHANITLYTQAELVGVQGVVGDFQVQICQQSRGLSDDRATAVQEVAPANLPDEFNYGLISRSVLYQPYPGCYPATPAVDWTHYEDGCLEINGEPLYLENKPKTFHLAVGAVVVATGFKPYEPFVGEYGYGVLPEVITLPAFIRLLALAEKGETLAFNGRAVKNIAFVHCVGSRQLDGLNKPQPDGQVNNYCSRVCCTATLQATRELHERYPAVNIYDVYEDIRTYGRGHETYYKLASENRVRFLRFHDDELPEVMAAPAGEEHPALVRVTDYLTWGQSLELPVDLVVLAVGMMPNPVDDMIKLLKINAGTDRFLAEVHPKLRPVETAVPGVLLAGTAQGPMNIQESCAAASAAAAKVAVLLGQGYVELEPFVAIVNPELCDGSGECIKECCYEEAISMQPVMVKGTERVTAVVSPANCAGCGVCVGACPNRAIDLQGWTLKQYEAMVEAIAVENVFELEPA